MKKNIDKYIATFPKDVQDNLKKIKETVKKVAPQAVETMSYGIPTFDLNGQHLVHFAAFKNHISFFPTSSPIPAFKKELTKYKTSRGTIQFPLNDKISLSLISKITRFRVREVLTKSVV